MDKKKTAAAGAAAVAAAAVTLGMITASPTTTELKGSYSIKEVNPYRAEVRVSVPEEFTPDVITLKMNDMEVSKTLLPKGYIVTYPAVVANTNRLSMDMYVRNEKAAEAVFDDDGTLTIAVKDKYLNNGNGAGETPTSDVSPEDIRENISEFAVFNTKEADNDAE